MSKKPQIIYGARLIDPATQYDGPGSVLVENGIIQDISHSPTFDSKPEGAKVLDAQGCVLAPALVDTSAQIQTLSGNGETPATLAKAATAGGISHILVHPSAQCPLSTPEDIMMFMGSVDGLAVQFYPAGQLCVGGKIAEHGLMQREGAIALSADLRSGISDPLLRNSLRHAGGIDIPVCISPMPAEFDNVVTAGRFAANLGLNGTPAITETIALRRILAWAQDAAISPIVGPITTQATVNAMRQDIAWGHEMTGMTTISHLTFNEVDIGDLNTQYRLSPPLRPEVDRRDIIAALRDQLIPIIASGHMPCSGQSKSGGFEQAAPGGAMVEDLLAATLGMYHSGEVELLPLWSALSYAPAQKLDLKTGQIKAGYPANFVLVDLDAPYVRRSDALLSACKSTPFDGRRLQGRVLKTWIRGTLCYDQELSLLEEPC